MSNQVNRICIQPKGKCKTYEHLKRFLRHSSESWNPVLKWAMQPCVYILANSRNGTLYTGVTSDIVRRVWEHKNETVEGFTKRYGIHTLVWYEQHETMESAISREKAIKAWKRAWKLRLIEELNPGWRDLYPDII